MRGRSWDYKCSSQEWQSREERIEQAGERLVPERTREGAVPFNYLDPLSKRPSWVRWPHVLYLFNKLSFLWASLKASLYSLFSKEMWEAVSDWARAGVKSFHLNLRCTWEGSTFLKSHKHGHRRQKLENPCLQLSWKLVLVCMHIAGILYCTWVRRFSCLGIRPSMSWANGSLWRNPWTWGPTWRVFFVALGDGSGNDRQKELL